MFPCFKLMAMCIVVSFICNSSPAGLIVTLGNPEGITYFSGSSGFIDVHIRSEQEGGQLLSSFGFEFTISPTSPTSSRLRFTDPQPDSQLTDPNYVLNDGTTNYSGAIQFNLPVGSVSGVPPGSLFIGGDFHTTSEILVPNTDKLLVRLQLEPDPTLPDPPAVGDRFTLSFVDGTSSYFQDADFEDIPFTLVGNDHQIEIIPEPSSFVLAGLLGGIALFLRRRAAVARRKQT